MGSSKLLTVAEAAKLKGVAIRTIYSAAKRGLIEVKCVGKGRRMYFSEDDILKLKKFKHEDLRRPLQKGLVYKLMAEVQTLRTQMATVTRLLNIKYDALGLTLPEYENFYNAADQMSKEGWPPHIEELWADYFVRLKLEDLEKIESITGDKHPWRPILRLVSTMHINPWNKDLVDLFAAGRTNITQVAGVWCVLKEASPKDFDIIQERDASPSWKLLRRLNKEQGPPEAK